MIVVSEAVRAAMARVDPALARRAVTIVNGVDLAAFAAARVTRRETRAALGYGDQDLVIGAVARFDRRKGLDLLLEAAAAAQPRVPALRLLLVGDGPERARLESHAAMLGLDAIVHWAGACAPVSPFVAAMDLFAAPSRTEGQGVALVEALAAGVPVVGARVGGIPEVVAHGRCGLLVEPESPDALAAALVRLAREPETRAAMGAAASGQAGRFSLAESCARLSRVYDQLFAAGEERAAA
ncbi:MAG: glycosyltransferase [Candidatus Eisenbacteria bacterium]|uniref:Glycosyltransferase n=1 Tax=Eiseniibacteriota bacterium TaxID=2212470 RepID=A0A538U7Y6_UNCEI|nr:MAG: glycosyltransferase [Candidatus Eisenbacteria bacterium]